MLTRAERSRIRKEARKYKKDLLNKCNHKCQSCFKHVISLKSIRGRITGFNRNGVFYLSLKKKQPRHALYATIDHIIDIDLGGTNDLENLTILCNLCNNEKGRRKEEIVRSFCLMYDYPTYNITQEKMIEYLHKGY